MNKLNIFHDRKLVGILTEDDDERLSFRYSESWIDDSSSFALSLALKIQTEPYGHLATKSFFENLLPEGEVKKVLEKKTKENIEDEFNFLKKYGIDCAGAFIITNSDNIEKPQKFLSKEIKLDELYTYLDKKQSLTSAMIVDKGGLFSLAGAQDKFPIIYRNRKIYLPLNGEPTTHILKPYVQYHDDTEDSPYNEYFSMKLAKAVGLNVPKVELIEGKYPLYIIERFDRVKTEGKTIRIHEQDFCQAQGLTSKKKYEDDGGPSIKDNYNVIKDNSSLAVKDLSQYLDWLWYNLLIGNHDCHSKNLSFLSTEKGLRLAPFYDILSTVIYKGLTNKFTFNIGGKWNWFDLKDKHFERLDKTLETKPGVLIKTGINMIKTINTKLKAEAEKFNKIFPKNDTANTISKEINKRIQHIQTNSSKLKT